MRGLIQRVTQAAVSVDGAVVGQIDSGVLLLLGIERGDTLAETTKLLDKVLNYRIFPDAGGRMNLNVREAAGGLLVVSQFTLVADTNKGLRPSFTPAATPEQAQLLYHAFVAALKSRHSPVATGVFGAHMQVSLTNDGPVTFLIDVVPKSG
jgi:D-tyrosyl-tRNA(Tyr) deacylase